MLTRSPIRSLVLFALAVTLVALLAGCSPAATANPTPTAEPSPAVAAEAPAAASAAPSADSMAGQWEGPINVAGQQIGMVIRFEEAGGELKGSMDIPGQSVRNVDLANLSYAAPKLHFETFGGARNAVYDGELQADGTISGNFEQAGFKGTFSLVRSQTAAVPATETPPYRDEEVAFHNGEVTLAGTLSLPAAGGPFPAVVLISGSGQQNRDEEVMGFPVFRLIADHFARNGIAVLRYDDRGIGGSTGDVASATSEDFADDAAAAVALLKTRPEINPKQIGLLGHSEGGLIAPMVAVRTPDVAFVIMMAGPGVPGKDMLLRQVADILKLSGAPQAQIDAAVAEEERVLQVVLTGQGWDELKAAFRTKSQAQVAALTAEQRAALGDTDQALENAVQAQVASLQSPWFRFFVSYDPGPTLEQLTVPVLALFGGKDVQVAAQPNEEAIKAAIGDNTQLTTRTYADANHLFQKASTGGLEEYAQLKDFVPGFLDDTVSWIKDAVKAR